MSRGHRHHLTVAGQPYCGWLGCQAGRDIAAKSGVSGCTTASKAAAERAKKALAPHFRKGAVQIVPGDCPTV